MTVNMPMSYNMPDVGEIVAFPDVSEGPPGFWRVDKIDETGVTLAKATKQEAMQYLYGIEEKKRLSSLLFSRFSSVPFFPFNTGRLYT